MTEVNGYKYGADELFGDKWFVPILRDLEDFENETAHFFPEFAEVTKEDSTDWVFQTLWNSVVSDSENNGLALFHRDSRTSRSVGTLVGVKWSLCEAWKRAYPYWKSLKSKDVKKIDDLWWLGFVGEVTEMTKELAEKHVPRFREIKKAAMNLALEQGGTDELDYIQGYTKGTGYLRTHYAKLQAPSRKTDKDRQNRAWVVWFVVCCGEEIEKVKGDLSWPEVHQLFGKFIQELSVKLPKLEVNIEEDTFIQILKRARLKGVGKPGRIPSNEKGTR